MNPPTPARIKAARKAAGLTQTAAAKLICCSLRSLQEWWSASPANATTTRLHINEPTDPCPNQSSPQGGGLDTNSSS